MAESSSPRAMVMLASEQLWPNIHGLVHWHEHVNAGGLGDVCIYHTENERSVYPAHRLARFCRQLYPNVNVHLPDGPQGLEPTDVVRQIREWQQQLSGRQWVLNATGGVKLMFAGALECAARPDTTVVYRELSGDWYNLAMEDGQVDCTQITVPLSETDAISVMDLISAQWEPPPGANWTAGDPLRLDVLRLTEAAVEHDWHWQRAFRAAGYAADEKTGFLFEQYVAAVLLEMGVANLKVNVRLSSQVPLQENDLIANYGGRLLLFDCKLRTKEEEKTDAAEAVTSQIDTAATRQRGLGGLDARTALIRPNRIFSDSERNLAQASRLTVLDRRDCQDMFSRLAAFASVAELPASLRKADELVRRYMEETGTVGAFAPQAYTPRRRRRKQGSGRSVVDVESLVEDHRKALGQDWVAFFEGGEVRFRAANPERLDKRALQDKLDDLLAAYGQINRLTRRKADRCAFVLHLKRGKRGPLEEFLETFLGRSLLGDDS